MPVATVASEQAPALGSAIHAAVAAGAYPDVREAGAAMGGRGEVTYRPDPAAADVYDRLYAEYERLHDYFGRGSADGGNDVMHRLNALRKEALS
jgi:L-ribulokinase